MIESAVELLKVNGFEGLAEAVTVLSNSVMVAERSDYSGAAPYERSLNRVSSANGYKTAHDNAAAEEYVSLWNFGKAMC